jgi:hypothetical protein
MALILGTDHSHYDWETQDGLYVPIDYDTAFQNGSRFTFLKVCNGAVVQSHALDELKRAMASPLLAAAYNWVFPIDYITADKQAQTIFGALGAFKKRFMWDLEETVPYAPRDPNGNDLKACILACWKLYPGWEMGVYSRWDYWVTHVDTSDPFWKENGFVFWWATGDSDPPEIPWDFWQDGGSRDPKKWGVKNGKQLVDTNWTNWTMEKLAAWFGEDVPVEPEPEPPTNGGSMTTYKVTVKADAAGEPNIRETGGAVLGRDIGNFHKGQVGQGTELLEGPGYRCLKVLSGADVVGWIYDLWQYNPTYALIEQVVEPPSTDPVKTHDIDVYSDGTISIDGGARQ